jgi:hypothetical protein
MRRRHPKYQVYIDGTGSFWVLRICGGDDSSEAIEKFDSRAEAQHFIELINEVRTAQGSLALH